MAPYRVATVRADRPRSAEHRLGDQREPQLEQAAEADQTHGCYVDHLDSWVLGRPLAEFERASAAPTAKLSRADHASVRALLAALIAAPAFRSVVQEAQ